MTAKSTSDSRELQEGSPSETAEPYHHPSDQSFVLQCMIDVQKSIGSLTKSVEKLESSVSEQSSKIDKVRYILAAAAGAIAVILIIGGFALDKIWDRLVAALQMAPPN